MAAPVLEVDSKMQKKICNNETVLPSMSHLCLVPGLPDNMSVSQFSVITLRTVAVFAVFLPKFSSGHFIDRCEGQGCYSVCQEQFSAASVIGQTVAVV